LETVKSLSHNKQKEPKPLTRAGPMYGRADDKNWGPDPHASIEVIKREKE
jgi:uncharacterized protein YceK